MPEYRRSAVGIRRPPIIVAPKKNMRNWDAKTPPARAHVLVTPSCADITLERHRRARSPPTARPSLRCPPPEPRPWACMGLQEAYDCPLKGSIARARYGKPISCRFKRRPRDGKPGVVCLPRRAWRPMDAHARQCAWIPPGNSPSAMTRPHAPLSSKPISAQRH